VLTDLHFAAFLDTSSADLIADFFVPALAQSVRYDRGVGYFSSGWLGLPQKAWCSLRPTVDEHVG